MNMKNFSQKSMREDCSHCRDDAYPFRWVLLETPHFWIIGDPHPLCEGHIEIISKHHISCVGAYAQSLYDEFIGLYQKTAQFLVQAYGSVATFEHGIFGQTVFHSHVHLLPFAGQPEDIVPEGAPHFTEIKELSELKRRLTADGGYLFFSIGEKNWIVDAKLVAPRFFRDRFASALGKPERGNWKEMHGNESLMRVADEENVRLKGLWSHATV